MINIRPFLFSLALVSACSNSSTEAGITITEPPLSCSSYAKDMAFVNSFESPVVILYDFNQPRADMINANTASITNCAKILAQSVIASVSAGSELDGQTIANVVFYSLKTENEYEADDVSALYFQYRILFEKDTEGWSELALDSNLNTKIWAAAK